MASVPVMRISRSDVSKLVPLPDASVTEPQHLASYNWIEAKTPTIVVPGLPPLWRGAASSRQLEKDSGLVYIAQNAARHPESPLEPLFRALYIEDPQFDISSVDIISDRNNIRKLLSFVDPSSDAHGVKDFTMHMELVNGTAIFHREETRTTEFISPDEFRGFGHEFEKAYTTNEIPASTGHHRVVSYRLGSIRLVIRHETDGYVDTVRPAGDDLSGLLESMSISQPAVQDDTTLTTSGLTVRQGGRSVALESTLEIKTRVHHKPLSVADAAPQLWLSQTPRLVRAYHNQGRFGSPVVEDVSAGVKAWEQSNQRKLGRLATLLMNILAMGKTHGHVSIKYSASKDRLRIERCAEKKMFPVDLYEKWEGGDLQKSDLETKRGGMPSPFPQANVSTTAGASLPRNSITGTTASEEPRASSAVTPEPTRLDEEGEPELPCFICQRMREGNPSRHGSLVSIGEIRESLLCARDFCDRHASKDWAVCDIDHGTYYRKHRHLSGVYASLADRKLALSE